MPEQQLLAAPVLLQVDTETLLLRMNEEHSHSMPGCFTISISPTGVFSEPPSELVRRWKSVNLNQSGFEYDSPIQQLSSIEIFICLSNINLSGG